MIRLIVPCYNEVQRLNVSEFKKYASADIQFVFVDDGSSDGTLDFLKKNFQEPAFTIVSQSPNAGKAAAVRLGITQALKDSPMHDSDWIGFWDADLATPLSELKNFLLFEELYHSNADAVWGSRVYRLGAKIIRSPIRHYLGRVFATVIANALRIEAYDTQCGAKIFRPSAAALAFGEPFLSKWIFDVEMLLRLKNQKVIEYPVLSWEDIPGSKIKVSREIFRVLKDIYRIRLKYLG